MNKLAKIAVILILAGVFGLGQAEKARAFGFADGWNLSAHVVGVFTNADIWPIPFDLGRESTIDDRHTFARDVSDEGLFYALFISLPLGCIGFVLGIVVFWAVFCGLFLPLWGLGNVVMIVLALIGSVLGI